MTPEMLAARGVVEILPTDWLDSLPVYDTYGANSRRLDMLRQIIDSFNYAPFTLAYPFGSSGALTFAGFATKEGSLQVPAGSYLLGITGYSTSTPSGATPTEQGPGFRFSITDKGSGLGIAERSFIFYKNLSGMGQYGYAQQWLLNNQLPTVGPYWLDAPFIITNPGQVQIAITNLSASTMTGQIAFHFAYPVNNVSMNTPTIKPTN